MSARDNLATNRIAHLVDSGLDDKSFPAILIRESDALDVHFRDSINGIVSADETALVKNKSLLKTPLVLTPAVLLYENPEYYREYIELATIHLVNGNTPEAIKIFDSLLHTFDGADEAVDTVRKDISYAVAKALPKVCEQTEQKLSGKQVDQNAAQAELQTITPLANYIHEPKTPEACSLFHLGVLLTKFEAHQSAYSTYQKLNEHLPENAPDEAKSIAKRELARSTIRALRPTTNVNEHELNDLCRSIETARLIFLEQSEALTAEQRFSYFQKLTTKFQQLGAILQSRERHDHAKEANLLAKECCTCAMENIHDTQHVSSLTPIRLGVQYADILFSLGEVAESIDVLSKAADKLNKKLEADSNEPEKIHDIVKLLHSETRKLSQTVLTQHHQLDKKVTDKFKELVLQLEKPIQDHLPTAGEDFKFNQVIQMYLAHLDERQSDLEHYGNVLEEVCQRDPQSSAAYCFYNVKIEVALSSARRMSRAREALAQEGPAYIEDIDDFIQELKLQHLISTGEIKENYAEAVKPGDIISRKDLGKILKDKEKELLDSAMDEINHTFSIFEIEKDFSFDINPNFLYLAACLYDYASRCYQLQGESAKAKRCSAFSRKIDSDLKSGVFNQEDLTELHQYEVSAVHIDTTALSSENVQSGEQGVEISSLQAKLEEIKKLDAGELTAQVFDRQASIKKATQVEALELAYVYLNLGQVEQASMIFDMLRRPYDGTEPGKSPIEEAVSFVCHTALEEYTNQAHIPTEQVSDAVALTQEMRVIDSEQVPRVTQIAELADQHKLFCEAALLYSRLAESHSNSEEKDVLHEATAKNALAALVHVQETDIENPPSASDMKIMLNELEATLDLCNSSVVDNNVIGNAFYELASLAKKHGLPELTGRGIGKTMLHIDESSEMLKDRLLIYRAGVLFSENKLEQAFKILSGLSKKFTRLAKELGPQELLFGACQEDLANQIYYVAAAYIEDPESHSKQIAQFGKFFKVAKDFLDTLSELDNAPVDETPQYICCASALMFCYKKAANYNAASNQKAEEICQQLEDSDWLNMEPHPAFLTNHAVVRMKLSNAGHVREIREAFHEKQKYDFHELEDFLRENKLDFILPLESFHSFGKNASWSVLRTHFISHEDLAARLEEQERLLVSQALSKLKDSFQLFNLDPEVRLEEAGGENFNYVAQLHSLTIACYEFLGQSDMARKYEDLNTIAIDPKSIEQVNSSDITTEDSDPPSLSHAGGEFAPEGSSIYDTDFSISPDLYSGYTDSDNPQDQWHQDKDDED